MRKELKNMGLAAVCGLSLMLAAVSAQPAPNVTIYGVTTDGKLVSFSSAKPDKLLKTPKLSGTQKGERLVGIDFRPSNKTLYGVSNQNRLYTINTTTGVATAVGTLTTTLTGRFYGVDFNPVPDRLRITDDTDQNLRANPSDATNVEDKKLVFAAADANKGKEPNVAASAYANNVAGAKSTTLYNIDSWENVLATQAPPNDGVLNTVGALGLNVTSNAGMDIITVGDADTALAALQTEGESRSKLYWINLKTGAATLIGKIGAGKPLVGIAISPN
jgi:hypothetical protein